MNMLSAEHTSDIVPQFGPALQLLTQGLEALRAVDTTLLTSTQLGHGLLTLQKVIDGLNTEHAKLMTEADKAGTHAGSGHKNMASWLAANGKTSYVKAQQQQKLGDAMNASPELHDAVTRGDLSPDAAGQLLPTLGSDHSGKIGDLIDACKGATPAEARAAGEKFQEINKPAGESDNEREAKKRAKRFLRFDDQGNGLTAASGMFTTPDARTIQDALAAIIHLWNDPDDPRTYQQKQADALLELAHAYSAGQVLGGRNAPTVFVTIDIEVLEGRKPGVAFNDKGDIVPAEVVRQMCTNANIARLLTWGNVPIDMGREARLATNPQWKALIVRDGPYCRVPGCCMPAKWCEVDHIQEWAAQQGLTDLKWLILLCVYHHHLRHDPGVQLHGDASNLSITLPNGVTVPMPSKRPGEPNPGNAPPGDAQPGDAQPGRQRPGQAA